MAKKKIVPPPPPAAVAPDRQQQEEEHRANLHNLKSLNRLLVKETVEMRDQVRNLRALLDDHSLLSSLQHLVTLEALAASVHDRLASATEAFHGGFQSVASERDAARSDLDRCKAEVEVLERRVLEQERRIADGRGALRDMELERGSLEKSLADAELSAGRFKAEMAAAVDELTGMLERERESCRLLGESERRLLSDVAALEREAALIGEKERERSGRVSELERTNEALGNEVERLCSVVTGLEGDASLMREEARAKELKVSELEKRREELEGEVGELVIEREKLDGEIGILRMEGEAKSLRVAELEKANGELRCEVRELNSKVDLSMEKTKGLESMIEQNVRAIDDLKAELLVAIGDKKETEDRMGKQEGLIRKLEEEIEGLLSKVFTLQELGADQEEVARALRSEIDGLRDGLEKKTEEAALLAEAEREKCGRVAELEEVKEELGNEVERLRVVVAELERDMSLMREEAVAKGSKVSELEKRKEELEGEVGELILEREKLNEEMGILRLEEESKSLKLVELEKAKGVLQDEVAELNARVDDGMEKANSFELMVEQNVRVIDDLKAELRAAISEKGEVEDRVSKQEGDITRLEREIEGLRSKVFALEELGEDQAEVARVLRSEIDGLRNGLEKKTEEAQALSSQIEMLQKSKNDLEHELDELRAAHSKTAMEKTERERDLHGLLEDKALLDKNLAASHEGLKDMTRRLESARIVSARAMSMLKGAAKAIHAHGDGEKRAALGEEELKSEADVDEDLHPFFSELEGIKRVYKSKIDELEATKGELLTMKDSVEEAKKRRGFWAWMSSATTVVAAISVVYAAKAH